MSGEKENKKSVPFETETYFGSGYGVNTFAFKISGGKIIFRSGFLNLGLMTLIFLTVATVGGLGFFTGEPRMNMFAKIVFGILIPLFAYGISAAWLGAIRKRVVFDCEKRTIIFYDGSGIKELEGSKVKSFEMRTVERKTEKFTPYTAYTLEIDLKEGSPIVLVETQYQVYIDKALKEIKARFL